MQSIQEDMNELRMQLRTGALQKAYKALLGYMLDLRTHFQIRYPGYSISGLYQGYMDMTYFAIIPPSLKQRNLKIAIVFNYDAFNSKAGFVEPTGRFKRSTGNCSGIADGLNIGL